MFGNFEEEARKVLVNAKKEMYDLNHPYVSSEHLLLAILKGDNEISEKLNLIDIVYEVIDARMPRSSKIVDIDDLIQNKPRILIMTKYDLCDKSETDKFISYYENLG